ncbi:MAG TPA: TIGR00730 family Rossman fold protein [Candidatus Bathyarchaeia archaeon]|nr:TIGR00730 family Rossman fold protein [Candidatus Bathyarchaeia archaeon]
MKKKNKSAAQDRALGSTEWRPEKAYKNLKFLNSPDARLIRILSEFLEPQSRLRRLKVRNTVVFYGSARTVPVEVAQRNLQTVRHEINRAPRITRKLNQKLEHAQSKLAMSRYYEDAEALAEKLTTWFLSMPKPSDRCIVCSGGGPGIMEAANRGAEKAGGLSMGLNISLPFEQTPNPYQTRDLAFEFHYFFIRKFWFAYLAKALIVFPGGFGTMDELFDLLTLVQTGKTRKNMAIALYGNEYWDEIINFNAMVRWGVISPDNLKIFRKFDNVDATFQFLKAELSKTTSTSTSADAREKT